MKVYTKVVIDMNTMEVVEEESFDYSGPVALCGGGGSGGGVDKAFNARMASIAETQSGLGSALYNFWRYGTTTPEYSTPVTPYAYPGGDATRPGYFRIIKGPNAGNAIDEATYREWEAKHPGKPLPSEWYEWVEAGEPVNAADVSPYELERRQIEANIELLPQQTGLFREQIAAQRELLPQQTSLAREQIAEERARIAARQPVLAQFYREALAGPNAREWARQAGTDMAAEYAALPGQVRRQVAATGANPSSPRLASLFSRIGASRQRDIAAAKTAAARSARKEKWIRLSEVMKL